MDHAGGVWQGPAREEVHWKGKGLFLLLKWAVLSLDDARLAVFLDLDMEVRGLDAQAAAPCTQAAAPCTQGAGTLICPGDAARPRPSCDGLHP